MSQSAACEYREEIVALRLQTESNSQEIVQNNFLLQQKIEALSISLLQLQQRVAALERESRDFEPVSPVSGAKYALYSVFPSHDTPPGPRATSGTGSLERVPPLPPFERVESVAPTLECSPKLAAAPPPQDAKIEPGLDRRVSNVNSAMTPLVLGQQPVFYQTDSGRMLAFQCSIEPPETVYQAALSDFQAYEELKPAREQLISANAQGPGETWLERFLFAAGQTDLATRNKLLLNFSKDFIREATSRARIILQEVNVPTHKKSIPPLKMGGVAGGTKFLDQGILFKFANDPLINAGRHLYGGSDADPERAAKAAANDLKGADAYFRCFALLGHIPIVVPPQVVMDFNGFRLIAMPWLPLSESQLVHGSADGGKTVYDDDDVMRSALKFAAHHLHLKRHWVKDKFLYSAGDVEAHLGKDGRRYLVDLARTFPPEDPVCCPHLPNVSSAVFFRLHRANFMEYLKNKQDPQDFPKLSPDAFSMWASHRDAQIHNTNAHSATSYLIGTRMEECAKFLLKEDHTDNCGQILQNFGISIRHLGLMRARVRSADNSVLDQQLLTCMVARCCKNLLRQDLREAALSKNVNDAIVDFLNALTGHTSEESFSFWGVKLPKDLVGRFGSCALAEDEASNLSSLCRPSLGSILKYVCTQTGITLSANTQSWAEPSFLFTRHDILSTSVRSKTFSVLEELLQEDNITQACESKTRNDFVKKMTKLARKATDDLAYLISIIFEPDELLNFFKSRAERQGQSIQLLTLAALALFFSDHQNEIMKQISQSDENWATALACRLPQVFSQQQKSDFLTSRLVAICQLTALPIGAADRVQSLLESNANPNALAESKDPVLYACVLRGHECLVEVLLEAKADVNGVDNLGHSLEQLVNSYSSLYSIGETLAVKSRDATMPAVRFRIFTLQSSKQTKDELLQSLSKTLVLKVKIPGSGAKFRQTASVQPLVEDRSPKFFPVYAEFLFESWPVGQKLKCTLFRNTKRTAVVYLNRPVTAFSTIKVAMYDLKLDLHCSLVGEILVSQQDSKPIEGHFSTARRKSPPPIVRRGTSTHPSFFVSTAKLFSINNSPIKSPRRGAEVDKILVLGVGVSGKTALVRRLRGMVGQDEVAVYVDIIRRNVITSVQSLLIAAAKKLQPALPENAASAKYLMHFDIFKLNAQVVSEALPHLQAVLADPGIQKTMIDRKAVLATDTDQRSIFQLSHCRHFLSKVNEIFAPEFTPSQLDCVSSYIKTGSVIESKAVLSNTPVRVMEVGGSVIARRKWHNAFGFATEVVFTVNLASDDEISEDGSMNRIAEALAAWSATLETLTTANFVLLFTFDDIFRQKLAIPPEPGSFFFGVFTDPPTYDQAKDYLVNKFVSKVKVEKLRLRIVFVNLLSEVGFSTALQAIQEAFSV